MPIRGRYAPRGFTLLELLVVISIIGLLMTGALITVEGLGRKMRFESAAKTLRDKIMLARNSAIACSHKYALRITQTPSHRWKLVIIDSRDNILDNGDDELVGDPYPFPKQIQFESEQEIEFGAEGGITFSTTNPIILLENSDKKEPWRLELVIYKASGIVRIKEIEKLRPEATTNTVAAAAVTNAPEAEAL